VRSRLSIPETVHQYPRLCEALLIPFVLLGIFWIFLGKYLGGEHSTATWLDNTHLILPLFAHISRSFAAGEFPYWINSIAGGVPLYNTPQFSILYPFYFFGWNLYRTPLDTSLHVHYVTLFHVGILWMSTYVMMRIFHLRIISSVLGATLFAFCANTYIYLFWVNIISPYSWLPLALGSVFLILENEHPKTGLVLGWCSIYLLTSASPAQPLIHFVYCAAFLVVSYGIIHRRDKSKLSAPVRNLVLLALGSILLSSPTLIPTVFSQRGMIRWTEVGAVVGNQRIPFEGFLTGQTKTTELAKVLFPLDIDQLSGNSYLGVLPVFLALFGLFKSKQRWIVLPLFLLALYTVLSSTGANMGLAYINYIIPLWNKIREPARHLYIFALAACALAAFGFEHLTGGERFRRFDLRKLATVFSAFLILLLGSYWVRQKYITLISDSTLLWSLGLFLAVLCASRFVPRTNSLSKALLAAIVVYPALWYPVPIVKISQGDYFMEENLRSHRVLQEVAKIKDIRNYRLIVADSQLNPKYWSMNATYYGLRTFQAYMNPLPFEQTQQMLIAPSNPRYSQLLGAKYYLSCKDSSSTAQPAKNDIKWSGMDVGGLALINPKTGETQVLNAGLHDRIADLTFNQGWVPLNHHGNPYQVINFGGGQMFVDPDRGNQAAPLNVILYGSWSPTQLQALPQFLAQHPGVNGGLALPAGFTGPGSESTSANGSSSPAGYSFEREIEGCKLYSAGDARPYYFLSTEIGESYRNVQEFLEMIQHSDAGISKVSVDAEDAREMAGLLGTATQPLSWETLREDRSMNSFNLSLRTNRRSLLILNEYFRNEWQVTLNGKRQKQFKVNLNQIAVLLPEGTNHVHFEYRPRLFVGLLWVQRAAMGILAAVVVGMAFSATNKAGLPAADTIANEKGSGGAR